MLSLLKDVPVTFSVNLQPIFAVYYSYSTGTGISSFSKKIISTHCGAVQQNST